jgi:hypothetical protein
MPLLFWFDISVLSIAAILALALTLVAFSFGWKQAVNPYFALLSFLLAAESFLFTWGRLALWMGKGNSLLLVELGQLALLCLGPVSLLFAANFLKHRGQWIRRSAFLGLIGAVIACIPLFRHQVFNNLYLNPNGSLGIESKGVWAFLPLLPIGFLGWSLVLCWQARHRLHIGLLAASLLFLAPGLAIPGLLPVS